MKIRPGNAQHQGARDAQQDSFGFSDLDDAAFVAHAGFLGVVADGMGGLAHGGAAGAVAVRALLESYASKRPGDLLSAALFQALLRANDAVVALARDTNGIGIGDVGTTAAVAVVHGAALHWIAAGDSRIYLWRAGRLTQVNADHVYAADLDAKIARGQISEQDARDDPDRDALTSHLGTPSLHRIDRSLEPYPLLEGDRVLICSDGLYRALDPGELAAPLAAAPQRACDTLIERAVAKGHPRQDNLTVLVIGLDADNVRSESGEPDASVTRAPARGAASVGAARVTDAASVANPASVANVATATEARTAGDADNVSNMTRSTGTGMGTPGEAYDVIAPTGASTACKARNATGSTSPGAAGERDGARAGAAAANLDIATLSRTGGRAANEDYADFLQVGRAGCWVIADGLGGHHGGEVASKTVVEAALESFRQRPEVSPDAVATHIARAQDALLEAQRREPSLSQMRSTIVVLLVGDTEAVWAHVGDSRLYHLRGGQAIARTRDHSVGQALVDGGQIDAAAQGSHEDRGRLLRCLGKEGDADAVISGPHRLARRDVFLLCTDGFWEALDDVALMLDLAASEDAAAWLDRLEARLRRRIGPAHDNYTATAIRILNDAIPAPPPHDPRAPAGEGAASVRPEAIVTPPRAPFSRVARVGIVAALVLAAVLVAGGVWKRTAIAAWLRTLMPQAGAVTSNDRTPKKPAESGTKPDAKSDAPPGAQPGAKPAIEPKDSPETGPDAPSPSGPSSLPLSSRPRGQKEGASKKPERPGDAKAQDGATNQDDVKKGGAAGTTSEPATTHAAPIDRRRTRTPSTPREEDR